MSLIELKGVSYSYPVKEGYNVKALRNVSLAIDKGERSSSRSVTIRGDERKRQKHACKAA